MRTNRDQVTRWLGAVMLACVGLLALAGCVKVDMDVTVNEDDTVTGSVIIAVDKEALAETSTSIQQLLGTDPIPGVTARAPYDDGTFVGYEYFFENTPLSEFNDTAGGSGDYLRIVRQGEGYRLDGVFDQTYDVSAAGGPVDDAMAAKLEAADIRVAVTFPGEVVSGNGTLSDDDRTMTWRLKLGERNEMSALAGIEREPEANVSEALGVLAVSAGVLVLVAIALFVQLRRFSTGSSA